MTTVHHHLKNKTQDWKLPNASQVSKLRGSAAKFMHLHHINHRHKATENKQEPMATQEINKQATQKAPSTNEQVTQEAVTNEGATREVVTKEGVTQAQEEPVVMK